METDNLWMKTHPEAAELEKNRTFGQHYMYDNVPNAKERVEMSFRTMGRQYDWDLEKYRNAKKPSDKGNKRRFMKNVARMFKNPVGYTFWKARRFIKHTNVITVLLSLGLFFSIYELNYISQCKQRQLAYLELEGQAEKGTGLMTRNANGNRLGLPASPLWRMVWSYPLAKNFVVNPVADQNYRMYFDRNDFK